MNIKLIKILEEQCYKEILDSDSDNSSPYMKWEFDKEKFASLIIKECLNRIKDFSDIQPTYSEKTTEEILNEVSEQIKKHFGIEK